MSVLRLLVMVSRKVKPCHHLGGCGNVEIAVSSISSITRSAKIGLMGEPIRPCHKAAILSRGTKKAYLFYHAKPHPHGFHCEA